jgi:hypothetical protein
MDRDGLTPEQAQKAIDKATTKLHDYLMQGDEEAAYNVCEEEFGLEPDYLFEII